MLRRLGLLLIFILSILPGSAAAAAEEAASEASFECTRSETVEYALGGRDNYFNSFLDSFIDTPHFRLHYSTMPGRLDLPGGVTDIAVADSLAIVALGEQGVGVVDVSIPGRPILITVMDTPGRARKLAFAPPIAWVADEDAGLAVADFTDPGAPRLATRLSLSETPRAVDVHGSLVLAAGATILVTIGASDPEHPIVLGSVPLPAPATGVCARGGYAYVTGDSGLVIVNLSAPEAPVIEGRFDPGGRPLGIALAADSLLCVALGSAGLAIFDASATPIPLPVISIMEASPANYVGANNGTIFVTGDRTIHAIGVGGRWDVFTEQLSTRATSIAVGADHVFVELQGVGLGVVKILPFRPMRDMIHGWPDPAFRNSLAAALEDAYAFFVDELAMQPPLSDGSVGGGLGLVDCYIYSTGGPTGHGGGGPPAEFDCLVGLAGYCGMDNLGVITVSTARAVLAHEVFHVFQYRYGLQDNWFEESTAAWAERFFVESNAVDPDVRCFLDEPQVPLWSLRVNRCFQYGASLFWHFSSERIHPRFPLLAIERTCRLNGRQATREEMIAQGFDMNDALVEFATWNNATGEHQDERHYDRRVPWKVNLQAEHAAYPVTDAAISPALLAQPAAANYIRFYGPGRRDTLRVAFDGDGLLADWRRVVFVATRNKNMHEEHVLAANSDGNCTFTLPDWPAYEFLTMIVVNYDTTGAHLGEVDLRFTYSALEDGAPAIASVSVPAPNPFESRAAIQVRITEDAKRLRLDIYDVRGRHVRRVADERLARGDHSLVWDGTGDSGSPLPQGVYFYRLMLDDEEHNGRFVILANRGG